MVTVMAKKKAGRIAGQNSGKEPRKGINVQIPGDLRDRLDALIERSGVNLRQHIIRALKRYLPIAEKRAEQEEEDFGL